MEHHVTIDDGIELWAEDLGAEDGTPLLLIMGANASSAGWPDELVARLARHHRVIRYDHRDTGRSTWAFAQRPYRIADLADDAVAVLDALRIEAAHVVGMSMGGVLAQLLLLDHPHRLRSAALLCTTALGAGLAGSDGDLPGPDPRLLELWAEMGDERSPEEELEWRVAHWRLLNGDVLPFDEAEHRLLEQRAIEHARRHQNPAAHASADQSGLDRGVELSSVTVPTLVVEAPEDPINPPPHAQHLSRRLGGAPVVSIPGMGHALPGAVLWPLATAILTHTATVDAH